MWQLSSSPQGAGPMNAMFTHRLVNRCHSNANMSLIRFNIIIPDAAWIDINITPRGLRCFLYFVAWNFLIKKAYLYYFPLGSN